MSRYADNDSQNPVVLTAIEPEAVAEVRASAPTAAQILLVAETFQALADPTRTRILYALIRRSLCVRDIAILVELSESAVSHQLRLLRDRRIVKTRRAGTTMFYSVDDMHVAALLREAEHHAEHVQRGLPDHPSP